MSDAVLDTNHAFVIFASCRHMMLDDDCFGQMVLIESAQVRSHVLWASIVECGDELVVPARLVEAGDRLEVLEHAVDLHATMLLKR